MARPQPIIIPGPSGMGENSHYSNFELIPKEVGMAILGEILGAITRNREGGAIQNLLNAETRPPNAEGPTIANAEITAPQAGVRDKYAGMSKSDLTYLKPIIGQDLEKAQAASEATGLLRSLSGMGGEAANPAVQAYIKANPTEGMKWLATRMLPPSPKEALDMEKERQAIDFAKQEQPFKMQQLSNTATSNALDINIKQKNIDSNGAFGKLYSGDYKPSEMPGLMGRLTPEDAMKWYSTQKPIVEPAVVDDKKYQDLETRRNLGQKLTPEESAWSKAYEKRKTLSPVAYGQSRMAIMMATPLQVYNPDDGNTYFTTKGDVTKNPGKYAGAEMGYKVGIKNSIFNEIKASSGIMRNSIEGLRSDFTPTQRLQFSKMLADEDKNAFNNFLHSSIGKTLTKDQIDYITSLNNMKESAYALRGVMGMGQGSDQLRAAIADMLPTGGTFSKYEALRKMDLFDVEVNNLSAGIPGLGGKGVRSTPKTLGETGNNNRTSSYQDGQTATNPQTGERLIFKGGKWQKM